MHVANINPQQRRHDMTLLERLDDLDAKLTKGMTPSERFHFWADRAGTPNRKRNVRKELKA
jgi:hypothetical protein